MADTEHEARVQNDQIEAVEARKGNAWGLHNNEERTSTTRPVHTSTRDVHGWDRAASRGKRKLDMTGPESLPAAKRIHSTGKERSEERSEPKTADTYMFLTRRKMRAECWSRSLPANGSKQDLRKRLRLHDATRAQISNSQESMKANVTSKISSEPEPLDRYTPMSQKDLRKECVQRLLPVGLAKRDLRRCIRLYEAARALGLTPEESLEAQKAAFQQSIEEFDVSPRGSLEENAFRATSQEASEAHTRGDTLESMNGQGPTFLETPEDSAFPSTNSQASLDKDIGSSFAITQDSTQDRGSSDMCPRSAATPNYAAMGQPELRSLCRSRSLKQHGFTQQLRMALITYDRILAEQTKNAVVKVDAEHTAAELGDAPTASPPPVAFIDLDSSSQDGEAPEQRTRLVGTSAAVAQEPVSGDLCKANKGQRPRVPNDAQVETRQGSTEQASAELPLVKGPYIPLYPPRLVLRTPKEIGNESSPWRTPYNQCPMSLQQPLVSLLNLTIKDARSGASESARREVQMKNERLSEQEMKMAEKEEFNVRYATEAPSWVCCCATPGYEVKQKLLANFAGSCFYHVSQLAQRGTFTMKEYQEYQTAQEALDRIASCLCQKPAVEHPGHQVIITQGGFILAQIWREQLTRRQSLTTFRPDVSAYRRRGILEVMHNVLEDFMIELSSRQQKRPLVLWARMEAMAWFINTLPTSNEWLYFQDWRRPRHYIMLFGIALLTTIDALLQHDLFRDKDPKVPNLGLVLALFIKSTWDSPSCTMNPFRSKDAYIPPFNNDICVNNENGWVAEVVSLADEHGVRIIGVESIVCMVDRWRLRKKSFESRRDGIRKEQFRREQYAFLHNRETLPRSETTLASIAVEEGGTPAKRGTAQRVSVRAFQTST